MVEDETTGGSATMYVTTINSECARFYFKRDGKLYLSVAGGKEYPVDSCTPEVRAIGQKAAAALSSK